MSLIGPRPERPEYVELFAKLVPGYTERLRVKSGITGWAQANGLRGQTSIADRVEFDNYYIENWSLALDLRILALTAVELLRFRDGRSDSLRDHASQPTAVPSFCLVVRVELRCAGRGRRLAGAARNNNRRQHVSAVIAPFEVAALAPPSLARDEPWSSTAARTVTARSVRVRRSVHYRRTAPSTGPRCERRRHLRTERSAHGST